MERLFLRRPAGGLKREPDLYDSLAAPLWRGYLSSLSKQRLSRRGLLNALIGAAIPFVYAVISLSPLCLSLFLSPSI